MPHQDGKLGKLPIATLDAEKITAFHFLNFI